MLTCNCWQEIEVKLDIFIEDHIDEHLYLTNSILQIFLHTVYRDIGHQSLKTWHIITLLKIIYWHILISFKNNIFALVVMSSLLQGNDTVAKHIGS